MLFSHCSQCATALTMVREQISLEPSSAEIQSLVWHLMHVRNKYAAAVLHPELRAVLKAKFVYYYPQIHVRLSGLPPLGEGPAVREMLTLDRVGEDFRTLALSVDAEDDLRLMQVLIDHIVRRQGLEDRTFLVEKRDFILPIRYSRDEEEPDHVVEWGRHLFGLDGT